MTVNDYLHLSYIKEGRSFLGVDCYGLCWLYSKFSLKKILPTMLGEEIFTPESTVESIDKNKIVFLQVNIPRKGDLVLFRIMGHATHIGIFIDNNKFLHILDEKNPPKIESVTSDKWLNRLVGIYRYEN